MSDEMGDRMKMYEGAEAQRRFMPLLPIVARLDGRSFSTFTRGMERPYDQRMSSLMVATTRWLVEETGALIGYTQSDEISLVWLQRDFNSQLWFNGRIQKIVSQLAAQATLAFNKSLPTVFPERAHMNPTFDARVWQVPNLDEAANALLWREQDATKNSVQMAARHYYSHNDLDGLHNCALQELLHRKGINWNDYPAFFKRGTYIQKRVTERPFSTAELAILPPKHQAHADPNLVVRRTDYAEVDMPPFMKVINRTGVIFDGEDPQVAVDGV